MKNQTVMPISSNKQSDYHITDAIIDQQGVITDLRNLTETLITKLKVILLEDEGDVFETERFPYCKGESPLTMQIKQNTNATYDVLQKIRYLYNVVDLEIK